MLGMELRRQVYCNRSKKAKIMDNQDQIRKIIYQIRKLIQAEKLHTKHMVKKYQVTGSQLNCILTLYENGPSSISQIAQLVLLKPSTVTGIIDRLEKKKLVKRMRISTDRRVVIIKLTAEGKMFAQNAPPPIPKNMMESLKNLSNTEIERILWSLNILTRMLDDLDQ